MKKRIVKILSGIIIAGVSFILLLYISNFLYIGGLFMPSPNKQQMEKNFERNKRSMITIVNYLEKIEQNTISINDFRADVSIEDRKTSIAIHALLWQRFYNGISKHDNTIEFQKWRDISGAACGIAYSMNGSEPRIEFLTKLEPLSEPNWYYYEEDYEEWRISSVTNGIPNYLLGVWSIQSAENRNTRENYNLQDLYGTDIVFGGKLTLNSDYTFSRYVGKTTEETDNYEGTYSLSYDNSIILKYNNGTTHNAKYLPSTQKIVYYTWDKNKSPVDEYYIKLQ